MNYPDDFKGMPYDKEREDQNAEMAIMTIHTFVKEIAVAFKGLRRAVDGGILELNIKDLKTGAGGVQDAIEDMLASVFRESQLKLTSYPDDLPSILTDEKPFRPQPTRGMAPTNPATHAVKGDI